MQGHTVIYMASRYSRVRKHQRKYRGEAEASILLQQLNDTRPIVSAPLRQVVLALQNLADCQPQPMTRQRVLGGDPSQLKEKRNIEAVNRLLRRYEARPCLRLPRQ